ncbi:SRPBCC family protein [Exilibacterium tricleocarpae]|nr:SRPBCC family protein [Exilibacterium tricleocarpae]
MKAIKIIIGSIVGLLVIVVVVGLFLPDTAHVERSVVIKAPVSDVYQMLNGFKRFNEWSPWHAKDPDTEYTFSGPEQGVGARMTWASENRNVGSGSQEIIATQENQRIEVQLDFGAEGDAVSYYQMQPAGDGTRVTWGFDTDFKGNIIGRYFGLMFDGMLGPDYENGLARLQALLEQ